MALFGRVKDKGFEEDFRVSNIGDMPPERGSFYVEKVLREYFSKCFKSEEDVSAAVKRVLDSFISSATKIEQLKKYHESTGTQLDKRSIDSVIGVTVVNLDRDKMFTNMGVKPELVGKLALNIVRNTLILNKGTISSIKVAYDAHMKGLDYWNAKKMHEGAKAAMARVSSEYKHEKAEAYRKYIEEQKKKERLRKTALRR